MRERESREREIKRNKMHGGQGQGGSHRHLFKRSFRTLPSPLISPTGPLRMCQSVHLDVPVFDAGAGMSQLPLSSLSETMERDGVRDGGEANEKGREGEENERGQLENTFL